MTGYIKRSDLAAKLTDLMLSSWATGTSLAHGAGRQEALHLIQDIINGEVPDYMKIPSADVVEVVRCKDCVHYNNNRQLFDDDICEIMYYSDGTHRTACERDFCSYGERKEGNNAK